ncbi:MAG TPA: hypothetical protein PLW86_03130, partial [Rhodocyclaceae bacterium]|nr:hypothetical protein [Rhodocyclaceae bacterium]
LCSLLGANVIGFGLLARLIGAKRKPVRMESAMGKLLKWFSLERGLVFGASLIVGGLAIDAWIFSTWVGRGFGEMASTVHAAFVATTVVLLGVNAAFGAFLFNMLREDAGV